MKPRDIYKCQVDIGKLELGIKPCVFVSYKLVWKAYWFLDPKMDILKKNVLKGYLLYLFQNECFCLIIFYYVTFKNGKILNKYNFNSSWKKSIGSMKVIPT